MRKRRHIRLVAGRSVSVQLPYVQRAKSLKTLALLLRRSGGACLLLATICLPSAQAQNNFYLHDGDRVVFYGDSITERGFYTSFVEDYVVTRFPNWNVSFTNAGWSGDWIEGGGGGTAEKRIARDTLANHPTVVTMMLGMNDGGYQPFDRAFFDAYEKGYRQFVARLLAVHPPIRITLLEPSPYDDITRPPQFGKYNDVMVRYGQFVRQLAQEKELTSVDFNAPMVTALQEALRIDPEAARELFPDEIHPSPAASLLLGAVLIKAWSGPSQISSVELNATNPNDVHTENAKVTDVKVGPALLWTEKETALPLPLMAEDPQVALILRSSDAIQEIDQELLRVRGLSAARYTLTIDGDSVGVWSSEQLAAAVNLALVPTPMLRQSMAVHDLTRRILALRIVRWQNLQVGLQDEKSPHIDEALNSLDALQTELVAERRAIAQPKVHLYELAPKEATGAVR
jgi:lysophospholipase L1-like esterase